MLVFQASKVPQVRLEIVLRLRSSKMVQALTELEVVSGARFLLGSKVVLALLVHSVEVARKWDQVPSEVVEVVRLVVCRRLNRRFLNILETLSQCH